MTDGYVALKAFMAQPGQRRPRQGVPPKMPELEFSGCRRLMKEIVMAGIVDYLGEPVVLWKSRCGKPKAAERQQIQADAIRWVNGEGKPSITYETACAAIGVNASWLRRKLRERLEAKAHGEQTAMAAAGM